MLKLGLFLIKLFYWAEILKFFLSEHSLIISSISIINAETSLIWSISINCSMSSFGVINYLIVFFIKIRRILTLQLLMNFNSVTYCFNLFSIILSSFALLNTSKISILIQQKPLFQRVLFGHRNKHSNTIPISIFFGKNLLFFVQSRLNFFIGWSKTLLLIDNIRNFFSITKK